MSDNGVHHDDRCRGSLGAIILICSGIILLLNNLGILPWSLWLSLWRLWPILVILAGLQSVFRGSRITDWLIYLFGLVFSLALIYLAITFSNGQLKREMNRYFPGNFRLPDFHNWR